MTMQVPLAFLNALQTARGYEIGLLADKVAERSSGTPPKALRRNFVPAPDFARAFVEAEAPRDEPLAVALAAFLRRTTGVEVGGGCVRRCGAAAPPAGALAAYTTSWRAWPRVVTSPRFARGKGARGVLAQDGRRAHARRHRRVGFRGHSGRCALRGGSACIRHWSIWAKRWRCVSSNAPMKPPRRMSPVWNGCCGRLSPEFKRARRQLPIGNPLSLKYAPLGSIDGLREDLVEGGFSDLIARRRLQVYPAGLRGVAQRTGVEPFGAAMARLKLAEPIIEAQAELKPWMEQALDGFRQGQLRRSA